MNCLTKEINFSFNKKVKDILPTKNVRLKSIVQWNLSI